MADLTLQRTNIDGVEPTFVAADSAGDRFSNPGDIVFHVKNGDTASTDVTITSAELCNQGFNHDLSVSVPAGGEKIIGPFDPKRFNVEGYVEASYSSTTSVTVAAIGV